MEITYIKSLWPENEEFKLVRDNIGNQYIFLHFLTPSNLILDGETVTVAEGSCILYDKFSYQCIFQDGCGLIHDWIHIEGDMDILVKKYGFEYNKIYKVFNDSKITKIIQSMESEYAINNKFSKELINIKLEELIINIIHASDNSINSKYINSAVIKRFLGLRSKINLTYNEEWDVDKMAAEVNLSTSRFYKIYKEIFGISPKKYLQDIRIEHAKLLLLQGIYSIREIAEMVGYKNQYHFIRQFKDYTGSTPGKYKE